MASHDDRDAYSDDCPCEPDNGHAWVMDSGVSPDGIVAMICSACGSRATAALTQERGCDHTGCPAVQAWWAHVVHQGATDVLWTLDSPGQFFGAWHAEIEQLCSTGDAEFSGRYARSGRPEKVTRP